MTFDQFRKITQEVKKQKILHGSFLNRLERGISVRLSWLIMRAFPSVSPNAISVSNVILVLVVLAMPAILPGVNPHRLVLLQILLLFVSSVLDKADGEVARYKSFFTQAGIYYDRLFHFIYPFALYLSAGYFFSSAFSFKPIAFISIILAVLAALASSLGKLRHHIKFKIGFEGHNNIVRDLYENRPEVSTATLWSKFVQYFVFMMYDWVWVLYLLLVLLAGQEFLAARLIFLVHALISVGTFLHFILVAYPKKSLFAKEDFK